MLDLVRASQRPVQPLDERRHRVGGVQRLVRVDLARGVGVGGDLPPGAVDRLEAGLDRLDGLAPRQRAEGRDEGLVAHELPELLGSAAGEGVLDLDGAAELLDVGLLRVREENEKGTRGRKKKKVEFGVEEEKERGDGDRELLRSLLPLTGTAFCLSPAVVVC